MQGEMLLVVRRTAVTPYGAPTPRVTSASTRGVLIVGPKGRWAAVQTVETNIARRAGAGSAACDMATKRPRDSAATTERSPKRRVNEADCEALPGHLRRFANFSAACRHYGFPGSHQVGSYGPKGEGIVRTYSNAAPGKDLVMDGGDKFLYRLKDSTVRAQFEVNASRRRPVQVFRKVAAGVVELGCFDVDGFEPAGAGDAPETWGKTFVRFVRRAEEEKPEEPEPTKGHPRKIRA